MLRAQQETTMSKHEIEITTSEVLTDDQLELVVGGVDAMGNIPICPPWFPGNPGRPGYGGTFPITNPIK
jgi:hypothetical protein